MELAWQACVRLALSQYGLISLDQPRAGVCSEDAIHRYVASGALQRVLPSVYRLAAHPCGWHQSVKALTLWGGEGTAASHITAAALLRLKGFEPVQSRIHVVTIKQGQRLPDWAAAHGIAQALPGCREIGGIPATPPWITLVHLGSVASEEDVARALDDGLHRGLVSLPQMHWALETFGAAGRAGTRVMRCLLGVRGPGYAPPESELEERFFAIIDLSGLTGGVRQFRIWDGSRWRRFDLAFPECMLAIELDGWGTHGTREAFEDDRKRDRAMQILGWRVLRFTWDDLVAHPGTVIAEIRRALFQNPR